MMSSRLAQWRDPPGNRRIRTVELSEGDGIDDIDTAGMSEHDMDGSDELDTLDELSKVDQHQEQERQRARELFHTHITNTSRDRRGVGKVTAYNRERAWQEWNE